MVEQWTVVKLADIAEIQTGSTPSKKNPEFYGGEYPLFKPGDLGSIYPVNKTEDYLTESGREVARQIPENSTYVTCIGATIGKTGFVDVPATCNQQINTLSPLNGVEPKLLFYWMLSPQMNRQVVLGSSSTTMPIINKSRFSNLDSVLPPLAEQKVIADKLDKLLAKVDSIKARLDAVPDTLKRFRQSVLAAAVSGKLTEEWRKDNAEKILCKSQFIELLNELNTSRTKVDIKRINKVKNSDWFYDKSDLVPNGWIQANLIEVTSLITCGVAKKPNYVEEGIPFLSAQNSKPFAPNLNKIKYVSEDDFRTFTVGGAPKKGDILYSRVGANFGEACVVPWDFDFAIYVSLTLIKPIQKVLDSEYLTIFLNSLDGVLQSRGGIMGSGIQNLNVESVRKYKILLPSIDEQAEIVHRVEKLFAYADKVEAEVNAAQERVNKLTQSILAKAFRGELTAKWREQTPELISDENSAEALLEKIKAEREKLKPTKKRKAK
ncbi:restriction endonuclease subunit S [Psychrobium sp. MM17-31]|uniref:restriction endonuclease subunit S n=1 Tax=Psychrobium sp. MM17-31 TaxID=2917758 RepID=UPI001EF748F9|nr:restriction endonuclease subunit S [Psychrobium sp. MM17-31]MCG7532380.1 restriction endonuclease subunit S [Psychrobium sp. MM17-31]